MVFVNVTGGGYNLVNDGTDTDQETLDRITGVGAAPPAWYATSSGGRLRTAAIVHAEIVTG